MRRTITFAKTEILRDRGENISTNVSHVNRLIVNNAISIEIANASRQRFIESSNILARHSIQ